MGFRLFVFRLLIFPFERSEEIDFAPPSHLYTFFMFMPVQVMKAPSGVTAVSFANVMEKIFVAAPV